MSGTRQQKLPFNYTRLDEDGETSHVLVPRLVQPGSRVLEFGCATGYMSEVLTRRLNCIVTGVELFPEPAEQARAHCARVVVGDAEMMDFNAVFGADRFDAILFADVLEHLKEPDKVLGRVSPLLADGGAVIASIPNIAHGSVRLALMGGEFRYRPTGLLDATHLRFFTRESVQELFEGCGYVITHWLRTRMPIDGTDIKPPVRPVPEEVLEWLLKDPESTTFQFVVRAERVDPRQVADKLLRAEMEKLRSQVDWLRRLQDASQELARLIPPGETIILADAGEFDRDFAPGWRKIPFLERDGEYWGAPPDGATAIRELERLRAAGARFMAFAWPAFWWLDHYPDMTKYLRQRFACLLENERLIVFDLK